MNHEGWLFFLCKGTSQSCMANGVSHPLGGSFTFDTFCGFWHIWIRAAGFLDGLGLVWILLPHGFFSSGSNLWHQLLVPTSGSYFWISLLDFTSPAVRRRLLLSFL